MVSFSRCYTRAFRLNRLGDSFSSESHPRHRSRARSQYYIKRFGSHPFLWRILWWARVYSEVTHKYPFVPRCRASSPWGRNFCGSIDLLASQSRMTGTSALPPLQHRMFIRTNLTVDLNYYSKHDLRPWESSERCDGTTSVVWLKFLTGPHEEVSLISGSQLIITSPSTSGPCFP